MTGGVMVFASMAAAPASAFLCPAHWLVFFMLYPVVSLAQKKLTYFRNLFFIALPPVTVFVWALLSHHPESASRSIRWVCAVASGVYFAGTLGPGGIASVLEMAGAQRLSDTMSLAGDAVSAARLNWKRYGELPVRERVSVTVRDSVLISASPQIISGSQGPVPVAVAVVSWLFLLLTISGRTL